MKRRVLSLLIAVCMVVTIIPTCSFANNNAFVDKYDFDYLQDNAVTYDFNFDGKMDTLKTHRLPDYYLHNSLVINDQKFLFDIGRHSYAIQKLYVTDIDTEDNLLDIIVFDFYKGVGARIFRYDGKNLLEAREGYQVNDEYWEIPDNSDYLDHTDNLKVITGDGSITFECGNDIFEYNELDVFEIIDWHPYENVFNAYKELLLNTNFEKYTICHRGFSNINPLLILTNYDNAGNSPCQFYVFDDSGKIVKIADDIIYDGLYNGVNGTFVFKKVDSGDVSYIRKHVENGKLIEYESMLLSDFPAEEDRLVFSDVNDLTLLCDSLYQPREKLITVYLNNEQIQFDQPPIIINDRVMVPIRAIFEALGYTLQWNQETQTAVAVNGYNQIKVTVGDTNILHSQGTYVCDSVPVNMSGRILVPVRAIAESAYCNVDWDGDARTVYIS